MKSVKKTYHPTPSELQEVLLLRQESSVPFDFNAELARLQSEYVKEVVYV